MWKRRRLGDREYRLDSVRSRGDRVVVAISWRSNDGQRQRWAHALRLRRGKIIDMQDFANPRSAAALMRLRTALA
jgi:ketosteroid isomerase-like protein